MKYHNNDLRFLGEKFGSFTIVDIVKVDNEKRKIFSKSTKYSVS